MKKELKSYNQKFKIYGRKAGRKLKKNLNIEILKKYQLNILTDCNTKKIILDIGSGNGENAVFLSRKYPNYLIIASDIYEDGNINLCKQLHDKKINNIKIFNQNVLLLFEQFNLNNLIKEIWILFPDPWPKTKHHKRRLINLSFLKKVSLLLEQNGKIYIVTDCKSYFIYILKVIYDSNLFRWTNFLSYKWDYSLYQCFQTRYFKKAIRNNKKSFIIIMKKI